MLQVGKLRDPAISNVMWKKKYNNVIMQIYTEYSKQRIPSY